MAVFLGIDWGAYVHTVCAVDESGEVLLEQEVRHCGEEVASFVDKVLGLGDGNPESVVAAIEQPHGTIVESLLDRGVRVFHIDPRKIDTFRHRYSAAGAKDDGLDARVLADTVRSDRRAYIEVHLPEAGMVRLRELSRNYDSLTEQAVALGNQVTGLLNRYYPQLLRLSKSWHEKRWLWDLFELAPTPQHARTLRPNRVRKLLKQHRIRRYEAEEVLERLREQPLHVASGVAEATSERIASLLVVLRAVGQQRSACSKRIEQLFTCYADSQEGDECPESKHRDAAILLSFPGIGIHNGAAMLSEATSALRERDRDAMRTLSGVAPVSKRTGGKHNSPRVSRRLACNPRLLDATHHWARVAVQCDPRAKAHYASLRKAGHRHARALRGVADRLVDALMAALRDGTLYDPERRRVPAQKAA